MSPRPRTVEDVEILMATSRAISREGPARFTLADVGREVGLSPATLLQRFGSKRGLLLALAELGVSGVDACFAAARAEHASPLAALLSAATEMTRHMQTPEELANGLAFLQIDVSDPDFHALALENARRTVDGYRTLIEEAVAAGELRPCDAGRLARAVNSLAGGSLISWAILREGTAEDWVRGDLDALLDPYRTDTAKGEAKAEAESKGRRRGRIGSRRAG
jgi:AcrR family transcriptional regulator